MLLNIDVGNTNIKLAIYDLNNIPVGSFRLRTSELRTADEYSMQISYFLKTLNMSYDHISKVVLSSVVPALTSILKLWHEKYLSSKKFLIVSPDLNLNITIKTDTPKATGADLIVNAVSAWEKFQGPTIILTLGTALTIVTINGKGEFLGGSITTGLGTSFNALVSKAAQLKSIPLEYNDHIIGSNTTHALQSGMVLGYVCLIEGMVNKFKQELNEDNIVTIINGGQAPIVLPYLTIDNEYIPDLTMDGLCTIAKLNL